MSVWQGNMRDKALRPLIYLTILCIVGISTRVTFIAFASPIAVEVFSWLLNLGKTGRPLSSVLRLVSMSLATAVISAALVVAADSAYFHPDRDDSYVITPLNFLRYNLSSENLAEHGLHPRWLHVAVNLPMIIGPGLLYYAVLATSEVLQYAWAEHSQASNVLHKINKTCIYMVLASLAIMSVQPHQEPRFLIPLLVPIIVLVSNSGYLARTGKLFWVTWIIINVALALLFGVLHQGGVVPSLLYLHDEVIRAIDTTETFDRPVAAIFYWKTYMPPRRFLGVFERDVSEGLFHISDHASSPPSTLLQHIVHSRGTQSTILVMPVHAFDLIPREVHNCFHIRRKVFPHLDLDNIAESMAIGGKDGMSLGIYNVDTSCLASWEFDVRDPIVDHR
ncbi:glycosyltransferase family 22 protein [Gelatoporia subvermispora B]|uniref:Mannosyltransferase n=1 Tax=Ceriporiopsis subvermispora (strain B) TaxID=914234 RepID=M2QXK8_CERS8|nr:glycosyltransferase family 22 protein [Gelatoporia subvermispora B]